ncbi:MAG: hypothetical protein JST81_05795 [Bacteroidetes bacterium]|jgi:hypothetical protein|nr:hypothetical protein [Bacteroidota bacterium]
MAKKKKTRKKELRTHLVGMMLIHLDAHALPLAKHKKLKSYLEKKMVPVINYYTGLIKRKKVKAVINKIKGD